MYTVRLTRRNHSVNVRRVTSPTRLKHVGQRGIPGPKGEDGEQGIQGIQGEPGPGIATGGAPFQVLTKASSEDYDTQWTTFEGSDKTYTQSFTVTNEIIVTHNMNKYPSVTVLDSSEQEVEGEVDYINTNQLVVYFAYPFSGKVICN